MRYLTAAFVAGFCLGWFMRRRAKGGGDLPPLAVVVFYLFTQFMAPSGSGVGNGGLRVLLDGLRVPARRAWVLEQQMSECRRHAFNGRVGEDTRTLKALVTFVRARWDVHAGAASYAAMHWLRRRRKDSS